jgi:hypothetical protein
MGRKRRKQMKYTVVLTGKATVTATLDIEASSPEEAEQQAMALADDCWEADDIEVCDVTETASANRDARVDLVMAIRKHARS